MAEVALKLCSGCKQEKPATLEFFHKQTDTYRNNGLTSWCKECRNRQKRKTWQKQKYKKSVIYFVQGSDLIKIGRTYNLDDRLTKLQCGSPVPLTLLGTVEGGKRTESHLHELFHSLRHHGEWFRIEKPLLDYIKAATS